MSLTTDRTMGGRGGFTLIELLVVVVIVGILAAIAVPQYGTTKEKAFDTAAKSDLRNLMTAQEAYFFANNEYAADVSTLETDENFVRSDGVGMSMNRPGSGSYRADASHDQSADCFRVTMGSTGQQEIERVSGAGSGSGDCSG